MLFGIGLHWAVSKIFIKNGKTLSVETEDDTKYPVKIIDNDCFVDDDDFWAVISLIVQKAKVLKSAVVNSAIEGLEECYENGNINMLYYSLELLNEAIFIEALESAEDSYGDGHGSDSDEEEKVGDTKIYAKKIITHNGMRAIWSAILTSAKHLGSCTIYLQDAYYEVPLGMKLIKQLEQLESVNIVKKCSEAGIIPMI